MFSFRKITENFVKERKILLRNGKIANIFNSQELKETLIKKQERTDIYVKERAIPFIFILQITKKILRVRMFLNVIYLIRPIYN